MVLWARRERASLVGIGLMLACKAIGASIGRQDTAIVRGEDCAV